MAAHPPLDERVHLVPDVEDEDRSDRFAQAKDDRFHGHVDPRIEGQKNLDRQGKGDGGRDRVEEETDQVPHLAGGLQAKLECHENGSADRGPSRGGKATRKLKGSVGLPQHPESVPSPPAPKRILVPIRIRGKAPRSIRALTRPYAVPNQSRCEADFLGSSHRSEEDVDDVPRNSVDRDRLSAVSPHGKGHSADRHRTDAITEVRPDVDRPHTTVGCRRTHPDGRPENFRRLRRTTTSKSTSEWCRSSPRATEP